MRVSGESFGANAHRAVLNNAALGVGSANGRTLDARILAALLDAGLGGLTVGVHLALRPDGHGARLAAHERIAVEAVGARADRVVVDHLAAGVHAARPRARILAALSDAGHVVRAVRVGHAFRLAGHVRIAAESRQTDAHAPVALAAAFGVGSARIGIAHVDSFGGSFTDDRRNGNAGRERIASEALTANADWHVIGHSAFGVRAARVGARVLAAVAHAALIPRAVGVEHALRPAGRVGIASVVGRAFALRRAADVPAFGVQSARRWIARLLRWFRLIWKSCPTN